jgi:hypothetical protein
MQNYLLNPTIHSDSYEPLRVSEILPCREALTSALVLPRVLTRAYRNEVPKDPVQR